MWSLETVINDVLSNQFIVQSPQRSAEYLVKATNKFLLGMRDSFKSMSDEEFDTAVGSVRTILGEKDKNLNEAAGRDWGAILNHKYNFNRQSEQLKLLKLISKSDVQAHFERVFFSDQTRRLDLQMCSSVHVEEQTKLRQENASEPIFKHLRRVHVD